MAVEIGLEAGQFGEAHRIGRAAVGRRGVIVGQLANRPHVVGGGAMLPLHHQDRVLDGAERARHAAARLVTGRELADVREEHLLLLDHVLLEIARHPRKRDAYLREPRLGSTLAASARARLARCRKRPEVQLVVIDGLSSAAVVAHDPRAGLGRPSRRTLAQRLGIDLALLLVAAIGLWQLRLYGAPLTRTVQGTLGLDPLLVAAPALALLAGAVAATRLLPRIADIAERALDRRRDAVLPLWSRQLARRPLRSTR